MPDPTKSQLHVDEILTNVLIAYTQSQDAYIADRVFPIVPVAKQSGRYMKYFKGDWFRDEAAVRLPGAESAGGGWRIDNTPTYYCERYDYHVDVNEAQLANTDSPANLFDHATRLVGEKLLLKREKIFVENYFKRGVWGSDETPATSWSSHASADPISDIWNYKLSILEETGKKPNVLVLGPNVMRHLCLCNAILERVKYGGTSNNPAVVTPQALAEVFDVERVLVPYAVENTAAERATDDASTATMSSLYGNHALLVYAASAPSILEPSGGYIFAWTGLVDGAAYTGRIKRWYIDELESYRIEGAIAFDCNLVGPDCGVFIYNAVS